jgi:hypothetical protein
VPVDAYSTGLTDGEVTIWVGRQTGEDAVYVERGDRFELWPRAGSSGVTDCS